MRVHIGGDHAAFDLHQALVEHLRAAGHEVVDHGPHTLDPLDDYPVFVLRAAEALRDDLAAGTEARGIVLGGSGNGEQMAANKVAGIRAALVGLPRGMEKARAEADAGRDMQTIADQHANVLKAIAVLLVALHISQQREIIAGL